MPSDAVHRSLKREVGLAGAVLLGLGSILGTGVFVSLGIASGVVGAAIVPAVVLAGLVATANGLSSASLAAAHPVSGGTYEYAYRLVHPVAGRAAGWMYLAAKSASAATAALGAVAYGLHVAGLDAAAHVRVALALALVVGVTALVASGLRRSALANAALVGATLLALAVFVFAVGASTHPAVAAIRLVPRVGDEGYPVSAFLEATALSFVAYTGYGRVATLGEEVRAPSRTIPRAVVVTLAVSMAVYVLVAAAGVAAVGAPAFANLTGAAGAPLEGVLRAIERPAAARWVAAGAVTAMGGVLLNLVLGLSRVALAMARRGDLPGRLAGVSERGPTAAVWAMGAVVAALTCVGDVRVTWTFSAAAVLVYYGLTNLAALRLPDEDRRVPRAVPVCGLVACLGLALCVDLATLAAATVVVAVGLSISSGARGASRPRGPGPA